MVNKGQIGVQTMVQTCAFGVNVPNICHLGSIIVLLMN